jgi:hypothetical protein
VHERQQGGGRVAVEFNPAADAQMHRKRPSNFDSGAAVAELLCPKRPRQEVLIVPDPVVRCDQHHAGG